MKARAHVYVNGRVQGVCFRSETREKALEHDVSGWVRNLLDGRVEAIFEGEKNQVDTLIEFCRNGPFGARVTNLLISWEDYTGEFRDFKIL